MKLNYKFIVFWSLLGLFVMNQGACETFFQPVCNPLKVETCEP